MVKLYKNKPKVVEAIQFDGTNLNEVLDFIKGKADYIINDSAWKVAKAAPVLVLKFEPDNYLGELYPGMYLTRIHNSKNDTFRIYTWSEFESKYEEYVPFEQFIEDLGI